MLLPQRDEPFLANPPGNTSQARSKTRMTWRRTSRYLGIAQAHSHGGQFAPGEAGFPLPPEEQHVALDYYKVPEKEKQEFVDAYMKSMSEVVSDPD